MKFTDSPMLMGKKRDFVSYGSIKKIKKLNK